MQLQVVFSGTTDVKIKDVRGIYRYQIKDKKSLKTLILVVFADINTHSVKEMDKWKFKVEVMDVS